MLPTATDDCPIKCPPLQQIVSDNTLIIDNANHWATLLLKEALAIKTRRPTLNQGIKASRELELF